MEIHVSNCYFDILVPKSEYLRNEFERRRLLENCTLHCKAGYVAALMGDVKTTSCLLKLISLQSQDGIIAGSIYHDNRIRKQGHFTDIAHVTTFNSHYFDHLTVSDYLRWAAQLRLTSSVLECSATALEVSGLMGLEPTSLIKDLSSGERLLLSVASELVSAPTLLCLDQPLEGLEEHEAVNVLSVFRSIAKRPNFYTTIIFTCTSLSAEMMQYPHSIHVFHARQILYSAETHVASSRCRNHLTHLSRILFTLATATTDRSSLEDRLMEVVSELTALPAPEYSDTLLLPARARHIPSSQPYRMTKPLFDEVQLLLARALSCVASNRGMLFLGTLRYIMTAVILGGSSLNSGEQMKVADDDNVDSESVNVISSLFAIVSVSVLGLTFSVPFMNSHFRMLLLELSAGYYHPIAVWVTLLIMELPVHILGSLALGGILRSMLALQHDPDTYYGAVVLLGICAYSFSLVISLSRHAAYRATQLFTALSSILLLLSGYFVKIPDLLPFFQSVSQLCFSKWAFELFMLASFGDSRNGNKLLEEYGWDDSSIGPCVLWLFLWFAVFQGLLLAALYPRNIPVLTEALPTDTSFTDPLPSQESSTFMPLLHKSAAGVVDVEDIVPAPSVVNVPLKMQTHLSFKNVGFSIEHGDHSEPILTGMSGEVKPYQNCCILDSGGEGAAAVLLQVLSGRASAIGKVSGDILFNNVPLKQGMNVHNCVVVPRGDSPVHHKLTVRETLRYACLLRRTDQRTCPKLLSFKQKHWSSSKTEDPFSFNDAEMVGQTGDVDERVDEVIAVCGLQNVADRRIGRITRKKQVDPFEQDSICLSAAQVRSLSIACELLNKPGLILLEEPLHGLQWYDAEIVARLMSVLAAGGRSLICTLTIPSQEVFSYFDQVLLINRGLLLYSGSSVDAPEHFTNIGYEIQPKQNPVEFLLDVAGEKAELQVTNGKRGAAMTVEDLAVLRHNIQKSTVATTLSTTSGNSAKSANGSHYPPLLYRKDIAFGPACRVLTGRRCVMATRNYTMIAWYLFWSLCVSGLLGVLWCNVEDTQFQSKIYLFSVVYIYATANLSNLFDGTHRRQMDYLRERSSGATSAWAYWTSDGTPVIMNTVLQAIILGCPLYVIADLRHGFEYFSYFALLLFMSIYCNIGLMYIVSAITQRPRISQIVFLGVLLPLQLVFSGSFIVLSAMESWMSWGRYLCPMFYFISGTFHNEYDNNEDALGKKSFEHLKNEYGFTPSREDALFALVAMGYAYRLVWLALLKIREVMERRQMLFKFVGAARKNVKRLISAAAVRLRRGSRANHNSEDAMPVTELTNAISTAPPPPDMTDTPTRERKPHVSGSWSTDKGTKWKPPVTSPRISHDRPFV